jgi:hypothetical protein
MKTPSEYVGHVTIRQAAKFAGCSRDPELVQFLLNGTFVQVFNGKRWVREIDLDDLKFWVAFWRSRERRTSRKGRAR